MRFSHFIPLLFILLEGCVDPFKMEFVSNTQNLVVDGLITNAPGPYEVKLSYTTSFANNLRIAPLSSGATIWIYDNFNNSEKLTEVSTGIYQTSKTGIRGQVGREYYIKIKTKFGREYQSSPQRLAPAGEIKDVTFKFDPQSMLDPSGNPGDYIDALKIIVNSKGTEGEQNLLRWRWNTIFKARTWPEYRSGGEGPAYEPAPEKCSGYVWGVRPFPARCQNALECPNGQCYNGFCLTKVAECTCCECWPYNYNTNALISHNRIFDGLEFKAIDLGNIPVGTQQFYEKYYLKIEQLSLSEDVYDFWNLVEKLQSSNGNLFQPNSAKVRGNIHSITDPEEEVLGIFGVSGVSTKEIYLTPDLVPYKLPPLDSFKRDCSQCFKLAYKDKPTFW